MAGEPLAASPLAPIIAQARSSRARSRSGSTTAPWWLRAIAAIRRRGRAVGAGRARDDCRSASAGRLRARRSRTSTMSETRLARSMRPRSSSHCGQCGERDLEKVESDAPVGIVFLRRERFELPPVDALDDHVVDQRRKVAGERVGLRRGRGDERGSCPSTMRRPSASTPRIAPRKSLAPCARRGWRACGGGSDRRPRAAARGAAPLRPARRTSPRRRARKRRAARCGAGGCSAPPLAASSASASAAAARCVGT